MAEVHILTYIRDNPGLTSSDLVHDWDKSKSAISQILNLLSERGLIVKKSRRKTGSEST